MVSATGSTQLEGVGYGMDSQKKVHQIEWYRDGHFEEVKEEKIK